LENSVESFRRLEVLREPIRKNGRSDLRQLVDATRRIKESIFKVLNQFPPELITFEFSSNDEFFIDLTRLVDEKEATGGSKKLLEEIRDPWKPSYLYSMGTGGPADETQFQAAIDRFDSKCEFSALEAQEVRLLFGSVIGGLLMRQILEDTGYGATIGIGSNKIIAKIGSEMHKPGSITIVSPCGLEIASSLVKIEDVPTLGGYLGQKIKEFFGFEKVRDLQDLTVPHLQGLGLEGFSSSTLVKMLETCHWLSEEPVEANHSFATPGCERKFYGNFEFSDLFRIMTNQSTNQP